MFDDFFASLGTADSNGIPLVAYVIDEKLIADGLANGDSALFVHVNTAAGGYCTKKNLWTFFGTMPFYVMGGTIVSYLAVDGKSGNIVHAAQFDIHSGYHKVHNVANRFSPSDLPFDAVEGRPAKPNAPPDFESVGRIPH